MANFLQTLLVLAGGISMLLFGLGFVYFMLNIMGIDASSVFSLIIAFSPIWLPIVTFLLFFERWMEYTERKFWIRQGRTTLRIKLPAEVYKSPEAMEIVLAQIHNVQSPDNYWQTYIDGKRPIPISLEIVSIGGDVRFYVNVPTSKTKNAFEAQMYAQYPNIEIVEEPLDYTADVYWHDTEFEIMSFHMGKKADDVFPIKTYIDFGLDKMPKEEEKVDPLTPMLEQLATLKPYERMWVQINAVAHRKKELKMGQLKKEETWDKKVYKKIDEIMQREPKKKLAEAETELQPRLTMGERDTVAVMERNAGKYAYEVGIQWMYITRAGRFNGDIINPTIRAFSQYDSGRNQIGVRWRTDFDYNWFSDPTGRRKQEMRKFELKNFKLRRYYSFNDADSRKIMTVEELATMFHIPGSVAITPSLGRIQSTRSEAPSNLPTAPTSNE